MAIVFSRRAFIEGVRSLPGSDTGIVGATRIEGLLEPESAYREREEKRRKARWAKRERHVLYRYLLPRIHAQLDAELRAERRAT
jgi:hypothetical protein